MVDLSVLNSLIQNAQSSGSVKSTLRERPNDQWIPPYIDQNWGISGLAQANNQSNGVQFLWNLFFKEFVKVDEDSWTHSTSISSETNEEFYTKQFRETLRNWFKQLSTAEQQDFTSSVSPWYVTDPEGLADSWRSYLEEIGMAARTQSPFIWIYVRLIEMLNEIQEEAINQGNRIIAFNNAEQAATDAVQAHINNFQTPQNSNDTSTIAANQQIQNNIQVDQGKSAFASNLSNGQSNVLNQSTSAQSTQSSLMSAVIAQMNSILSLLFK